MSFDAMGYEQRGRRQAIQQIAVFTRPAALI
jgi:hypothetical protein